MIVVFYIYLHESTCAYWMINKEVDIEGAKVDIEKMFYDTNVRMTLGQMSKSEFKRNYKNGNYSK